MFTIFKAIFNGNSYGNCPYLSGAMELRLVAMLAIFLCAPMHPMSDFFHTD